ncbi:RNA polymerase sigma factor [Patescibacteria group bacterium]|nr:RNA polymerase sigma factor [Patescibacteria group bacterium]MBU4453149.1 RNA polymerase sigma factor [Patescibacteria group bacterium]MCG2687358.1 RNA polymerase sigma factor [Candidatus Parcubacteria bacterium]
MRHRNKFLLFRVFRFRDTAAYGELYNFYVSRIRRFIAFRVAQKEDAEELTAEVFLRGWEYATSSLVNNPAALFYRIARNVIADHYRKRRLEVGVEDAEDVTDDHDIAEDLSDRQDQQKLIAIIRTMKEEYKDVLIMRYLDELSIGEIAESLEKTTGSVRVLLHRAKKALRLKTEK